LRAPAGFSASARRSRVQLSKNTQSLRLPDAQQTFREGDQLRLAAVGTPRHPPVGQDTHDHAAVEPRRVFAGLRSDDFHRPSTISLEQVQKALGELRLIVGHEWKGSGSSSLGGCTRTIKLDTETQLKSLLSKMHPKGSQTIKLDTEGSTGRQCLQGQTIKLDTGLRSSKSIASPVIGRGPESVASSVVSSEKVPYFTRYTS
jgi:hypothetical protein